MAFLIKDQRGNRAQAANGRNAIVEQLIQVSRAAKALPQTTNQQIFRIYGGRVWVKHLIGTVTTVIEGTDPVAKVTYAALTDANTLVGTAYDIGATLDISSDEVGTLLSVEGDGSAIISGGQVAGSCETTGTGFIAAQGQLYLVTGASKTGAIKWDLWYMPLDNGAYVVPVDVATVAIT